MKILDRLITVLLLIVLTPIALLFGGALVANWDSMGAVGVELAGYGRDFMALTFLCARTVIAAAALGALLYGGVWALKQWQEHQRQRDGSHRLRTYKVQDPATNQPVTILVNPDAMIKPALAISALGVREIGDLPVEAYQQHQANRATVAAWQARTPGDAAIVTANGSMYRMGGLGGSAKQKDDRPPAGTPIRQLAASPDPTSPDQPPAPPPHAAH